MRKPLSQTGPMLWLAAVIAAFTVGAALLWAQEAGRGRGQPEYSVQRTDDRGAALVYRAYERLGLRPSLWDQSFLRLEEPGLLILLAPEGRLGMLGRSGGEFLPQEIEALDRWVRAGNVAVIMSREENSLFYTLGLITDEPEGNSLAPAEPAQASLLAAGVEKLQTQSLFGFKFGRANPKTDGGSPLPDDLLPVPQEPPFPPIPAEEWLHLFVKKEGARAVPQVVSAARGQGLYVAVNDQFPAGNLGVTQGDNLQFMLNLARLAPPGGTIWFDEYHKRHVDRGLVAYFRDRGMTAALIYAALLLLLLFWRTGSRFGAPAPLVRDPRRDSGEYVRAVAALYRSAGMTRQALSTLHADFCRRLLGAKRGDGLTDLDEIGIRYERRTGRPALEARQILIETEAALARASLTEEEALHHAARLTRLDEELHRRAREADQTG